MSLHHTTTTTQAAVNAKRMPRRVGTQAPAHVLEMVKQRRERMNARLKEQGLPTLPELGA